MRIELRLHRDDGDAATEDPSPEQIAEALGLLRDDGLSYASIEIHDPGRRHAGSGTAEDVSESLFISGGEAERLSVAHIRRDAEGGWDQDFVFLTQPDRGSAPETQGYGGGTTLPARWWVDRSLAIRAATHYAGTRQLDPGLVWEHSLP